MFSHFYLFFFGRKFQLYLANVSNSNIVVESHFYK